MKDKIEMKPAEKMDWLLNRLFDKADAARGYVVPAQWAVFSEANGDEGKRYFPGRLDSDINGSREMLFYLKALRNKGYIEPEGQNVEIAILTVEGLNQIISSREDGQQSTRCFVAMSFDEEDRSVFDEAIVPACNETGFTAVRIDQQHLEADVTINDAMLAEIKRSRFCIADFSKHKKGVYFEAGYALGRGMKVIYTCRKEDLGNAHFDTKPYQHIVYADLDELKRMLRADSESVYGTG